MGREVPLVDIQSDPDDALAELVSFKDILNQHPANLLVPDVDVVWPFDRALDTNRGKVQGRSDGRGPCDPELIRGRKRWKAIRAELQEH